MDKYDVLFLFEKLLNVFDCLKKENRKELYEKYLRMKKEWLLMEFYALRNKKSVEYNKKYPITAKLGIHEATVLHRNRKYMWDMLKPIDENKKEK